MNRPVLGVIASLETTHWTFEAHGLDKEQARAELGRLLTEHGRQCELAANWAEGYEPSFHDFVPGTGRRDSEIVTD
jgi:hypothetical protein